MFQYLDSLIVQLFTSISPVFFRQSLFYDFSIINAFVLDFRAYSTCIVMFAKKEHPSCRSFCSSSSITPSLSKLYKCRQRETCNLQPIRRHLFYCTMNTHKYINISSHQKMHHCQNRRPEQEVVSALPTKANQRKIIFLFKNNYGP